MYATDPRFPLGKPLNRSIEPSMRPIPGRPNWYVDVRGVEHYVETHRGQSPTAPSGRPEVLHAHEAVGPRLTIGRAES